MKCDQNVTVIFNFFNKYLQYALYSADTYGTENFVRLRGVSVYESKSKKQPPNYKYIYRVRQITFFLQMLYKKQLKIFSNSFFLFESTFLPVNNGK